MQQHKQYTQVSLSVVCRESAMTLQVHISPEGKQQPDCLL